MAITHDGRSPIIMDAAGDELASIFQGRDMYNTGGVPRLQLRNVEFVALSSGPCILKHVLKDGSIGAIAFQSPDLDVGQNWSIPFSDNTWLSNVICDESWPANSRVMLYYA